MIDSNGNYIIKGDPRGRHWWSVCAYYHEKCPWALGEGLDWECNRDWWDYHLIDLGGAVPHCPFKYREQI
jgi:hypothetical protein